MASLVSRLERLFSTIPSSSPATIRVGVLAGVIALATLFPALTATAGLDPSPEANGEITQEPHAAPPPASGPEGSLDFEAPDQDEDGPDAAPVEEPPPVVPKPAAAIEKEAPSGVPKDATGPPAEAVGAPPPPAFAPPPPLAATPHLPPPASPIAAIPQPPPASPELAAPPEKTKAKGVHPRRSKPGGQPALAQASPQQNAAPVERDPSPPDPASAQPPPHPQQPTADTRSAPEPRSRGWYTVQPGDCLWSIARHLPTTGASDAAISRKVDAIWRLNVDRIASGRPDLIAVGERLRLP